MTKFATACQNLWKKIKAQLSQSLLVDLLFCVGLVLVGLFMAVVFDGCSESMANLLGIEEGGPSKKYKTLRFLGIGIGGVLVALQAVMSYRRAKAMEDAAQAQAKAVSKTEQGQRQERLKNAIEHLGNGKGSVRLGGAYELFHLAQDTRELRQTVLDILCAHIRQTTSEDEYREEHRVNPSEEVQSMLTLLFVQEHEVFKNCRTNLQGSWLNGASLTLARLARANLNGAYLRRTVLVGTQLQGAHLMSTRLQGAHLGYARLQGAHLVSTQLQGAHLVSTQLQGADLGYARLQGAHLGDAQLQGAVLRGAGLQGAVLRGAGLQGAVLRDAGLQGAVLRDARLQGATSEYLSGEPFLRTFEVARARGATSEYLSGEPFEGRIRDRIDKESDLSGIIFAGGLRQEDIDSLVKGLSDVKAPAALMNAQLQMKYRSREPFEGLSDKLAPTLREILKPHLGKPSSNEPPAEAETGAYTAEDAEQWIAEYKQAMSEVPKAEAD